MNAKEFEILLGHADTVQFVVSLGNGRIVMAQATSEQVASLKNYISRDDGYRIDAELVEGELRIGAGSND